ncbi:MAG: DUF1214 domain-containing protein [Pseudomonadales bacterium]
MTWRFIVSAGLVALVLGVGSATLVVGRLMAFGESNASGWQSSELAGQSAADIYTRAAIARIGLLALTREETLYFSRYRDADGAALNERCVYQLEGTDLPARWWSITLYASDNYLAQNGDGAASMDQTRVVREHDGRFRIRIGRSAEGEPNWISSRNAGNFSLTLRLYNPEPALLNDTRALQPPVLRTLFCSGAET